MSQVDALSIVVALAFLLALISWIGVVWIFNWIRNHDAERARVERRIIESAETLRRSGSNWTVDEAVMRGWETPGTGVNIKLKIGAGLDEKGGA